MNQLRTLMDDPDREHFMVVFQDGSNHLIKAESVSVGTITSASVYPREVVRIMFGYSADIPAGLYLLEIGEQVHKIMIMNC